MIYISNNNVDPYFNLAAEEYIMRNFDDECFTLWRNMPSIIVGKNQNTASEINAEYVIEKKIPVVRRLSGGGAVFHDLGNINFTFIVNKQQNEFADFKKFSEPIINALYALGIKSEFSGRNDITIDGMKFSGNAQHVWRNRVLHHGTLLFAGNLTDLSAALKTKPLKYADKSVKSVASRVTNISKHLKEPMSVTEFMDFLMKHIMLSNGIETVYKFNETDIAKIQQSVIEKYSTWEWVFGASPEYNFKNEKRFPGGTVEYNILVQNGIINDIKIFGDFFGENDIADIEKALISKKHEAGEIKKALENFEFGTYIKNVPLEDFILGMF